MTTSFTSQADPLTDELAAYDYALPDELIARRPAARRDDARLMIVDRAAGTVRHGLIRDCPDLRRADDCLVMNDTRVVRARLLGHRAKTGGRWEGLFLDVASSGEWRLLSQCRGKLQAGEQIAVHRAHAPQSDERLVLELTSREEDGIWRARPVAEIDHWAALERFGTVPLPPYMHRERAEADDFERYQTVYAQHPGSVAAPTAGLHFTPELLARCRDRGAGEGWQLPKEAPGQTRQPPGGGGGGLGGGRGRPGGREGAGVCGTYGPGGGAPDFFPRPPYQFRAIDALLTNFHLPRSTLLV